MEVLDNMMMDSVGEDVDEGKNTDTEKGYTAFTLNGTCESSTFTFFKGFCINWKLNCIFKHVYENLTPKGNLFGLTTS